VMDTRWANSRIPHPSGQTFGTSAGIITRKAYSVKTKMGGPHLKRFCESRIFRTLLAIVILHVHGTVILKPHRWLCSCLICIGGYCTWPLSLMEHAITLLSGKSLTHPIRILLIRRTRRCQPHFNTYTVLQLMKRPRSRNAVEPRKDFRDNHFKVPL